MSPFVLRTGCKDVTIGLSLDPFGAQDIYENVEFQYVLVHRLHKYSPCISLGTDVKRTVLVGLCRSQPTLLVVMSRLRVVESRKSNQYLDLI